MRAVEANAPDVVDYLLKHGADPSLKDAAGETAVDLARRGATRELAEKLDAHRSAHPDPVEFYAGRVPILKVVSGNQQSGSPGCVGLHPLVVAVQDVDGDPLPDAPVNFAMEGGGRFLLTTATSPGSPSLLLRADAEGKCRAYVRLPDQAEARVQIIATAGSGDKTTRVPFTAMTNDGTGGASASSFDPSNVQGQANRDGSADIFWQNHTEEATCIKVSVLLRTGWKVFATLPPNANSAHIPSDWKP